MQKKGYVYILASARNGTLYIGVTSDLRKRNYQHQTETTQGFAERYKVNLLVYYEAHETIMEAIAREKAMKKWNRAWKMELIEQFNPDWKDLSSDIAQ